MLTPLDADILTPTVTGSTGQYVQDLKSNLEMAQRIAKENATLNSASNKTSYDKKSKSPKYQLGQLVLLKDEQI